MAPSLVRAHGGTPQVRDIVFPSAHGHRPFALTDNQGVYAQPPGEPYRWLCEDAVAPFVQLRTFAVLGDGRRWLAGTLDGLLVSDDGGCDWAPVEGALGTSITVGLWPHPARPLEVLAAPSTFGAPDDVYLSDDGGRTWTGAGLSLGGRTTSLLRATADPDRVYVGSGAGLFRSDDGGRTFVPIPAGPAALDPDPGDLALLGTSPVDRDVVFAVLERIPVSSVLRSGDGGERWERVLELEDFPRALVVGCDGEEVLLASPFDGMRRSGDGGRTWTHEPPPVEFLGVVRRQPGTARLWSSTNVYLDGPWVLAFSDDFGRSWTPHLEAFDDVVVRWACPEDSATAMECDGFCPGQPRGAVCEGLRGPEHPAPPAPRRCGEQSPEEGLGPPDAGSDAGSDAGRAPRTRADAGGPPARDAVPPATPAHDAGAGREEGTSSGCAAAPGAPPWPILCVLGVLWRPGRRRGRAGNV